MEIRYSPGRVARFLSAVVVVLGAISLVVTVLQYRFGYTNRFLRMFDIGIEATVPTWYASVLLLLASLVLALIAYAKRRLGRPYVLHWLGLSVFFLLFSIDEVAMFHERLDAFLTKHFETAGLLLYIWVIPGAIFTLVVGLAYLRFLLHLPADTRWLTIAAGLIFVSGALGLEMLQARHHDLYGYETMTYALLYTAEELMEKFGVILFLYAMLDHLQREVSEVRFVTVPGLRPAQRVSRAG